MSLPFVARSTADALRERICFLESQLARVNSRNEELVNALTQTRSGVVAFHDRMPQKDAVAVRPKMDSFHAARKLEREHASNVRYPFPNTPEFDKLREKSESGAAG